MKNFARIENNVALETFAPPAGFVIADCMHPDIAAQFSEVPDDVTPGSVRNQDGTWEIAPEPEPAAPIPVAAPDKRITRLAFRKRFTQEEKIGIEMAALDDPTAPLDQRKRSAALRVNMKDADNAEHVDLSRQDTREDVFALELSGLIGAGRAYEILDAEIQPIERPQ